MIDGLEVFRSGPLELRAGGGDEVKTFTLPELHGSIEGAVRDEAGVPMSGALVVARHETDLFNVIRADEKGRYRFAGLPDGSWYLEAQVLDRARPFFCGAGELGQTHHIRGSQREIEDFASGSRVHLDGKDVKQDLVVPVPWTASIEGTIRPEKRVGEESITGQQILHHQIHLMATGSNGLWVPPPDSRKDGTLRSRRTLQQPNRGARFVPVRESSRGTFPRTGRGPIALAGLVLSQG